MGGTEGWREGGPLGFPPPGFRSLSAEDILVLKVNNYSELG